MKWNHNASLNTAVSVPGAHPHILLMSAQDDLLGFLKRHILMRSASFHFQILLNYPELIPICFSFKFLQTQGLAI